MTRCDIMLNIAPLRAGCCRATGWRRQSPSPASPCPQGPASMPPAGVSMSSSSVHVAQQQSRSCLIVARPSVRAASTTARLMLFARLPNTSDDADEMETKLGRAVTWLCMFCLAKSGRPQACSHDAMSPLQTFRSHLWKGQDGPCHRAGCYAASRRSSRASSWPPPCAAPPRPPPGTSPRPSPCARSRPCSAAPYRW